MTLTSLQVLAGEKLGGWPAWIQRGAVAKTLAGES